MSVSRQNSSSSSGYDSQNSSPSSQMPTSPFPRFYNKLTTELVEDTVFGALYTEANRPRATNKFTRKMRRVVAEMTDKHVYLLNGMMLKLEALEGPWEQTVSRVADELFADGNINWGRIGALFTFVQRIARHALEHPDEDVFPSSPSSISQDAERLCSSLSAELDEYVNSRLYQWIEDNGGWDSFLSELEEQEDIVDSTLKKGLVVAAVGGLLAYLTLKS